MGVHVEFELDGEVGEYVAAITDGSGWYANVEDYLRHLIRQHIMDENAKIDAFKAEVQAAFAVPEEDAVEMTADEFLAQMKSKAA